MRAGGITRLWHLACFWVHAGRFARVRLRFRRGLGGWLGEPVRDRVRALRRSVAGGLRGPLTSVRPKTAGLCGTISGHW